MSYIIDRLIILFLSLYLFYFFSGENATAELLKGKEIYVSPVVLVLILVIVVSLLCYVDSRKNKGIIVLVYSLTAVFMPSFAILSPAVIYDIYGSRFILQALIMIMAIVNAGEYYSVKMLVGVVIITCLSCILNDKSTKNEKLFTKVKRIRDDEQEKNILLAERNKSLIEKQNNELYVATLKERNRIAREIHDNVGHMLTRSILQMGALMAVNREEPLHGQLASVKDSLDTAMNNIRESVHDLHDEAIDLKQAVNDAALPLEGKFRYRLEYDISTEVDRKYKYAIISIVKEGVSNIIKHSKNNLVDITLREHPAMYQIIIHDYSEDTVGKQHYTEKIYRNKKGYISGENGIGLQNMRDRVDDFQGNITITTDRGYKVFITLPKG
ncbi:MAG: sensor histidine kinase [Lachnospiraceae bacterium]|nr:sensor histidine kinase [Lachnospiraceae bacterium]